MRVLVQRVLSAKVVVEEETIGAIDGGLLLLVGIHGSDGEAELQWMAKKCANLRIFEDEAGKMNRSLVDVGGQALVVSQFTLYGDAKKGNRPSFIAAARTEHADPAVNRFCELLSELLQKPVQTGRFGAEMKVHLINDGPVTLFLERGLKRSPPPELRTVTNAG